jgi:hypothetical protein
MRTRATKAWLTDTYWRRRFFTQKMASSKLSKSFSETTNEGAAEKISSRRVSKWGTRANS